ncbi:MAG: hypothetical protein RR942_01220 [Romboutsia sp.]
MFEKLRHNFVRKGLVLVVTYDKNNSIGRSEELINKLYPKCPRWYDIKNILLDRNKNEFEFNGYKIRFISSMITPNFIRGHRPEVVYWCAGLRNNDLYKNLNNDLVLSSRLQPFRWVDEEDFMLDQDILTNDFKIKDYIDTKSFGYKLTRNKYVHKKWNEFKNKLMCGSRCE